MNEMTEKSDVPNAAANPETLFVSGQENRTPETVLDDLSPSDVPLPPPSVLQPPTVGETLRTARESRYLTTQDIAQSLHLGERQVLAMEANEWNKLPGTTIARGFVRNYAKLMGLDPAPLMAQMGQTLQPVNQAVALPEALPEAAPTDMAAVQRHIGNNPRDRLVIGGGVAILAFSILVATLLPDNFMERLQAIELPRISFSLPDFGSSQKAPATPATSEKPAANEPAFPPGSMTGMDGMAANDGKPAEPAPATPAAPAATDTATSPAVLPAAPAPTASVLPVVPVAPATAPATIPAPAVVPPAAPAVAAAVPPATPAATTTPVPAAGNGVLQLSFEGDSWVTVRNKQGKSLVSQNNKAGSVLNVEGEGPFSLTIGNAATVTLKHRQQVVDLKPHIKGTIARLKLD